MSAKGDWAIAGKPNTATPTPGTLSYWIPLEVEP